MTSRPGPSPDEFETIARLLRPLARAPEALGLEDDAAAIPSRPGQDLVVSKDAMVDGVHFLEGDPLDLVARKLLRTNLSDLAAKGAEPYGYFLAVAWPAGGGWARPCPGSAVPARRPAAGQPQRWAFTGHWRGL